MTEIMMAPLGSPEIRGKVEALLARMSLERPVAMVFGARDGELIDNESAMRMLRSFRRDGLIDEHVELGDQSKKEVAPFGRCEVQGDAALVAVPVHEVVAWHVVDPARSVGFHTRI